MRKINRRLALLAMGIGTAVSLFGAGEDWVHSGGAVFVMTNDATKNEVIAYERAPDGQLFVAETYGTGGRGSGGITDPLQSQGSLVLSENHSLLFAANAGSGSVSVFRVWGSRLRLIDGAPSGGSEPLSIAQKGSFVYVLNGAAAGSVVVFRWDDHQLRQIPDATYFLSGTSAGASSITVSPDGRTLVVTERLTNNIDTFAIHPDGTLGPLVINGSTAPGVFSARFAPQGALVVSETGPAGAMDASAMSSYSVTNAGKLSAISQSVPTLGAANCWNAITPDGRFVYASNAASSTISGFAIDKAGALTPLPGTVVGTNPAGSINLDIAISSDGKYLYTLNSGGGTISIFAIEEDGTLRSLGDVEGLPKSVGFNGIAAL